MLQHWTPRRKASLIIHSLVVLIPLIFGTISALLFWQRLFQSWLIAAPMVAVIDALALLGLVLFICRIESPFVVLRHALPFVSIVPLGIELWQLLTPHNDWWVTAPITLLTTGIMVGVAWRCYVTIEQLFVDPLVAEAELLTEQADRVRQRMQHQVSALTTTLTALADMETMAVSAVQQWSQRPQIMVSAAQPTMPALTDGVSTQAVKAYAEISNVSERTVWRQLKSGKLTTADILGDE